MTSSKFRLRGDYYNFSEVSVVYLKNSRVIINGYGMDLAPDYSLAQFLAEYNEWLKETEEIFELENGWYEAGHTSGSNYYLFVHHNGYSAPWLGEQFAETFFPAKKKGVYINWKKVNWGPLNDLEKAKKFVRNLNDTNPNTWKVV